ncbi:hypothetical protein K438DRAFT_1850780 [Mycena galopus ATCC 62051]|nr:hypothetical protein K438DRAFT_1850780 [Mycena galopus ATCC 62051]
MAMSPARASSRASQPLLRVLQHLSKKSRRPTLPLILLPGATRLGMPCLRTRVLTFLKTSSLPLRRFLAAPSLPTNI